MLKKSVLVVALMLAISPAFAEDKKDKDDDSGYSVTFGVNTDSFFGLTPQAFLSVPLTDTISLTGYTIMWGGIGNSAAGQFGHWTEFGGGLNFSLLDGALNINPQLGILNGTLLSRGGGQSSFAEGVVPSVIVLYEKDRFELEVYAGYYVGTQTQTNPTTNAFGVVEHGLTDPTIALLAATPEGQAAFNSAGLKASYFPAQDATFNYTHVWAFPGYKVAKWLSAGLHWEELRFLPGGGQFDEDSTVYTWQGLYLTLKAGKGSLRVAAGTSRANATTYPTANEIVNGLGDGTNGGLLGGQSLDAITQAGLLKQRSQNAMDGSYYRVTFMMSL